MTVYYVSNDGNDAANGTSEATPWQTIAKVNGFTFKPGDMILFRRGDTWFEVLQPPGSRSQGQPFLVISCYGYGPLPNISNYKIVTSTGSWVDMGGNVWRLDLTDNTKWNGYQLTTGEGRNVGHIRTAADEYRGGKKFTLGDLASQWQFYSDTATGLLYVYSVGNPSSLSDDIRIAVGNRIIDGPASAPGELTGLWISGLNADGCAGHFIGDAVRDSVVIGCRIQAMGGGHQVSAPVANTRYGNGIQFGLSSRRAIGIGNIITDCYDTATTCQGERSGGTSAFIDCQFLHNEIARCEQAFELYLYDDNGLGWAAGIGFDAVGFRYNRCYDIGYGWSHDVRPDQNSASPLLFYKMDQPYTDVSVEGNIFYRFRGNFLRSGSGADLPAGYNIGQNYVFGRADQEIYNRGTSYNMTQWSTFAAAIGTGEDAIVQILETDVDETMHTSLNRMINIIAECTARLNLNRQFMSDIGSLVAMAFGTAQSAGSTIMTGNGPPNSGGTAITPTYVGQMYQDTTTAQKQPWVATGTSGTSDWAPLMKPLYGAGPPNSGGTAVVPSFKGQQYLDTTTNAMWHASGTSGSTDWRVYTTAQVNTAPPGEAPAYSGRIGVDTAGQRPYFSIGTSAISDWVRGWMTYDNMLALTDAATVTPNLNLGPGFSWTIGGNRTLENPSNARPGDQWMIAITQDGTGGRTISYGTLYQGEDGYLPHLSPQAGYCDVLHFEYDGVRIIVRKLRGVGNVAPTGPAALTDAASITPNLFAGKLFHVTLGGNRTLENPTNPRVDDKWCIRVTQDGTGGRTLSFGTQYDAAGGVLPTLTAAAGAIDYLYFHYDGARIVVTSQLNVN